MIRVGGVRREDICTRPVCCGSLGGMTSSATPSLGEPRTEVAVWAEARSIFNALRKSETPQAASPFCFCFFFLPLLTGVHRIWLSESACHFRYVPRSSHAIISYHAVALPACSLSLGVNTSVAPLHPDFDFTGTSHFGRKAAESPYHHGCPPSACQRLSYACSPRSPILCSTPRLPKVRA